ncbi:UDP-N-acetylglucosamine 2-epimerase (non-hydrolyzing) [Treponema putidum]|uniref:non-hydrolyzing UDP-N-acetylglucosamine 2-epimerase n=1 Tax=Treponema putidum TaxID=221027 RepID=UPI0004F8C59B|nr:UDP-N-acetylglucosamine 2-epimerase (non-hydrolyzing) [Treponema putidum]AIN94356.1 UDP-N-acetylglucosamine 2-epimerase [Treponema putidum]TWI79844.1 UDP-N-acetylglucosamine 2-epimerase (non-hydrolysing) [Treponema putidum]
MKVLVVFGTRPEAIKMCPLILEMKNRPEMETVICLTGQHKEMLRQVMDVFNISESYNLDIMKHRQTLTSITASILEKLEPILLKEEPDVVLVHGDTTTSFAAALAAFYQKIPVGHVEAGLRTNDMYSPFPEEMNRLLTDRISSIYFAPTEQNKENLLKEGIINNVYVTGNTVIDSFAITVKKDYTFHNQTLKRIDFSSKRVVLVTAHRRENLGTPIENICDAISKLANEYADVIFIYPVHLNPAIRDLVFGKLAGISNIFLIDPVDVLDMHNMMARCYMVMTDSGGIQEEAPHFGKPVLVLRTETERPEAVKAGTVMVVGVDSEKIYKSAKDLLDDSVLYSNMAKAVNPYGDGHAGKRIVDLLLQKVF